MIDLALNKLIAYGQWIGADLRRLHIFFLIIDVVAFATFCSSLIAIHTAWQGIVAQSAQIAIPSGQAVLGLIGPALFFLHFAITPLGQGWIKKSASSYTLTFLVLLVGLGTAGFLTMQMLEDRALAKNYAICTSKVLKPNNSHHIYTQPGVACPQADVIRIQKRTMLLASQDFSSPTVHEVCIQ
jgi:hypothetical protein